MKTLNMIPYSCVMKALFHGIIGSWNTKPVHFNQIAELLIIMVNPIQYPRIHLETFE